MFEGLPALVSARYVTTDLAPIRRFAVDRAPDPSPGDAYDDLAQVEWRILPETGHFASPRSRYQVAATASGSQLLVSAGLDTDGDHQPDREEELCRGVAGSASECTFEFTYGGTRWWYWPKTSNRPARR